MSQNPIQVFVPSYEVEECLAEIRKCLEVGWTGLGFKTIEFEDAWKAYTGLPHAHFLNSNTVGLQLALKVAKAHFGWADGDEVISTPLTFVSTNHAILYEKMTPVFADIDDSLCLDPESIAARITPRTRAVMYVGVGGNPGRLEEVIALCRSAKLFLILDAAHMAGTRVAGKHVGEGADCTVFSFQAVKNLPTADSGMICFADPGLDKKVRVSSWLGINKDTYARTSGQGAYKWHYDVETVGLKAHGNSVMASIGLVQLRYLDRDNDVRRDLSARYETYLDLTLPIRLVPQTLGVQSSRHLFQIRVPGEVRDPLIAYLNTQQIYPGVHYRSNTRYAMYQQWLGRCPNAELADSELVSLPLHLRLTDSDLRRVCDTLMRFLTSQSSERAA